MKNANTMARKRRLISAAAGANASGGGMGAGEEEEGEEEEDEEDDMDDMEDDMGSPLGASGSGNALNHASSPNSMMVDGEGDELVPRRKSSRVTNAAAVIKLRTQDVVAHTALHAAAMANHSPANARTAGKRNTSPTSTHVPVPHVPGLIGPSSNGAYGQHASSVHQATASSSPGGKGGKNPLIGGVNVAGARKTSISQIQPQAAYGVGPNALFGGAQSSAAAQAAANLMGAKNGGPGSLGAGPYGMHPAAMAAATYGGYLNTPGAAAAAASYAPHFRTDIFSSAEEAAQFYSAVKAYERETDRAKVLKSIKDYFLPHRTVEEISNMVDLAFPSMDTAAAAAAAAAAVYSPLHPMYASAAAAAAQGARMGYPYDATAHAAGQNAQIGLAANLSSAAAIAAAQQQHQQQQSQTHSPIKLEKMNVGASSNAYLGYGASNVRQFDPNDSAIDFGAAPTRIDSSSLASLSEHMMKTVDADTNAAARVLASSSPSNSGNGSVSGSNNAASPSTGANASSSSSSSSSATNSHLEGVGNATGSSAGSESQNTNSSTQNSSSSTATNGSIPNPAASSDANAPLSAKKKEQNGEDDDLMSELATLTGGSAPGAGGLSGILGGRPLALSPGVFGAGSGSTPLGFNMTPFGMGTTPLGFMSPLGLSFATQSPLNPYFSSQK